MIVTCDKSTGQQGKSQRLKSVPHKFDTQKCDMWKS